MDYVLREIEPGRPGPELPIRNPLAEVRWLAFLRGDAYVNPFHDLLHALSRKEAILSRAAQAGSRVVRFLPDRLLIIAPDDSETELRFADVLDLRLHYARAPESDPRFRLWSVYYLKVTAKTETRDYRFNLTIPYGRYRRLLDDLYDHRVPFREFTDGLRTFKLKTPGYGRIQQLKKQYGIRW